MHGDAVEGSVRTVEGSVRACVQNLSFYQNRKPWIGNGLIEFRDRDKVGVVDSNGKVIIPPRFDYSGPFSCGLAAVVVGKKHGYVKKDGAWLIEPVLDWAYDFEDGFASASKAGRYGILTTDGKWHLEPQFVRLDPLAGGWFAVRANGEEGFYDPKSKRFIREGKLSEYYKKPKAEPITGANNGRR